MCCTQVSWERNENVVSLSCISDKIKVNFFLLLSNVQCRLFALEPDNCSVGCCEHVDAENRLTGKEPQFN